MIRMVCSAIIVLTPIAGAMILAAASANLPGLAKAREPLEARVVTITLIVIPLLTLLLLRARRTHRRRWWKGRYGFEPPPLIERLAATGESVVAGSFALGLIFLAANALDLVPVSAGGNWGVVLSNLWYVPLICCPWLARYYWIKKDALESTIVGLLERRHRPCMTCGYDLTPGNLERCPECGTPRENPR
ncbi:MAG: hypothetical protein AMXMBFR47_29840 [Planctomycetota bacterium]